MNEFKYDKMMYVLKEINKYLFINTILLLILLTLSTMIFVSILNIYL